MTRTMVAILAAGIMSACGSGTTTCAIQTSCGVGPPRTTLTVFAAASLQPAFDKIGAKLLSTQNLATTFSYAGTQTLTTQLTQGAPADVFASADVAHMTTIHSAGLLYSQSVLFAHNRLEIAVAKGNPKGVHSLADLARSGLVVVLADPSVPAGKYAAQALQAAGVTVHPVSKEVDVKAAVAKVTSGEADATIVYVTDVEAAGSKGHGVPIPDNQNVVADYPIAVVRATHDPAAAAAFVDAVVHGPGQDALRGRGFAFAG